MIQGGTVVTADDTIEASVAIDEGEIVAVGSETAMPDADETAERAQFIVEEHGRAVYVHHAAGNSAVRTPESGVGMRIHLHATAAGKAILAFLTEERQLEIVEQRGYRLSQHIPSPNRTNSSQPSQTFANVDTVLTERRTLKGFMLSASPYWAGMDASSVL